MIKWAPYAFVRITIFLMIGIIWAIHYDKSLPYFYLIFGISSAAYICLFYFQRFYKKNLHILLGVIAAINIFSAGVSLVQWHNESYHMHHILHKKENIQYLVGKISSDLQEKPNSYRAILDISHAYSNDSWQAASGKVLLYISKDSLQQLFAYGDKVLIKAALQPIAKAANPYEFNFKQYLKFEQVYHQQYIKKGDYALLKSKLAWSEIVLSNTIKLRNYFDHLLKTYIPSPIEYGIVSALILGVKEHIDGDVLQAYAHTGTTHILAVSGLHVAVIFGILHLLLGKLQKIPIWGKWLYVLLVLIALWGYAFITGLSASVLRAVVMFSCITIAKAIQKRGNIYNTLAFSAFLLLCFDPYFVMSVGFQLSYLAVLGIVYIHPRLFRLWEAPYKILHNIWQLASVSIAAQIATLPLTIYYFYQFPSYFLLSNFIAIPISSAVVYTSLAALVFSPIPYVSQVFGWLTKWLVFCMNKFVIWVDTLPYATLDAIVFNEVEVICLYLVMIFVAILWHRKKFIYILPIFFCITWFSVSQCLRIYKNKQERVFCLYHLPRTFAWGIQTNDETYLLTDSILKESKIRFSIQNHWYNQGVGRANLVSLKDLESNKLNVLVKQTQDYVLLSWQNKTFLVIRKPLKNRQLFKDLQVDFVIIQNNSVRFLVDLKNIRFSTLIIDGTNQVYLANKMSKEATKQGIHCHNMYELGAFIIK